MSWLTIIGIAFALAMDAFAVAISAGMTLPRLTRGAVFRLSWHFGLFQCLMPIVGWIVGLTIDSVIKSFDHWIAFGLLVAVGGKMLWEALHPGHEETPKDPTRGWSLVVLSVATSIDALAIGLTMAMLGVTVWIPSLIIGLVAGGMTILGMFFGRKMGNLLGGKMELAGGVILILIGSKILYEHLSAAGA